MEFHEKLKERRLEWGYTQKQVADFLFISPKTYSQYERGIRNVDVEIFLQLIQYLYIDIDDIDCTVSTSYFYDNFMIGSN